MRVISGVRRGTKLDSPQGLGTRPTLDRVKEALFSIIFQKVSDAQVLDLFAGSGALGIEALSRGAAHCTFVDSSGEALGIIRSNLEKCRFSDVAEVKGADSVEFLKRTEHTYDIIFLDPPYAEGFYAKVLEIIKTRRLLKPDGIVTAECDAAFELDAPGFDIIKDKKYGRVRLCVLEDNGS